MAWRWLWDVDTARGEALAAELCSQGANALFLRCDVANKAEVEAALAGTLTALPRIHALVNNAGIFKAAFLDISEADWDAVIGVNLKRRLPGRPGGGAPHGQSGGGSIVNMSSVNGVMAIPSIASYNVSKGGVDQLTRVMALAPGRPRHPRQRGGAGHHRHRAGPGGGAGQQARARILSRTPLRRLASRRGGRRWWPF